MKDKMRNRETELIEEIFEDLKEFRETNFVQLIQESNNSTNMEGLKDAI